MVVRPCASYGGDGPRGRPIKGEAERGGGAVLVRIRGCLRGCRRRFLWWGRRSRRFRWNSVLRNNNMRDLYRPKGLVVGWIARHESNLLHQGDRRFVTLTKDRIAAIQVRSGDFGDKELRSVGVRTGVRVRQPSGLIKEQISRSLILELVAGIARPVAGRIASLNHEARNHAMKNRAVIKRNSVLIGATGGIFPVFRPRRKAYEVGHSDRSLVWE